MRCASNTNSIMLYERRRNKPLSPNLKVLAFATVVPMTNANTVIGCLRGFDLPLNMIDCALAWFLTYRTRGSRPMRLLKRNGLHRLGYNMVAASSSIVVSKVRRGVRFAAAVRRRLGRSRPGDIPVPILLWVLFSCHFPVGRNQCAAQPSYV